MQLLLPFVSVNIVAYDTHQKKKIFLAKCLRVSIHLINRRLMEG